MVNENDMRWGDVSKKRNALLGRSDWTQLPDSGLSKECVKAWRLWRRELRDVDKDSFQEIIPAVLEISRLEDNMPELEYGNDGELFARQGAVIGRVEFKNRVQAALDELGIELNVSPERVDEPVEEEVAMSDMSMAQARKYAQNELEKVYRERINQVSPAVELNFLYTERLNQAIDMLSGNGTSFPLLELLADELDEPIDEVATNLLKKQNSMISNFMAIEKEYIECLKMVKQSDKMSDLEKALEIFNGC